MRYHHLSPAYDADTDAHEAWLLAQKDVELLEVAIYHLPANVVKALAGTVRAIYSTHGNETHLNGALDATRALYDEYLKARNEE